MDHGTRRLPAAAATVALMLLLWACSGGEDSTIADVPADAPTFGLTSPAFAEGAAIPQELTCDGEDSSPPLRWSGVPAATRSLALITDDPDAPGGDFVHWVVYAIPADGTELPAAIPTTETIATRARQGVNGFGRLGYGGPCPPPGGPHRYFFTLYALGIEVDLEPRAPKRDLLRAMEGHILAQGRLTGTYQRR